MSFSGVLARSMSQQPTKADSYNITLPSLPLTDLPGYSRSVYAEDHALLTPESRVWAPNTYGW